MYSQFRAKIPSRRVTVTAVESDLVDVSMADRLIVRVVQAGICGADVAAVRGHRDEAVEVLGHEMAAQVVELPESLTGELSVGDLVVLNSETSGGVFEDVVAFDQSDYFDGRLIRVPETVPFNRAVLAEPLACVLHAIASLERSLDGARVGIIGGGNFAELLARWITHVSTASVVMLQPSSRRSAVQRVPRAQYPLLDRHLRENRGREFDVLFLAVSGGTRELFDAALDIVRPDGIVHVWGRLDGNPIWSEGSGFTLDLSELRQRNAGSEIASPEHVHTRDGTKCYVTGSRGARYFDFRNAFEELAGDTTWIDTFISDYISVDLAPAALATLADRSRPPQLQGKVIIDMRLAPRTRVKAGGRGTELLSRHNRLWDSLPDDGLDLGHLTEWCNAIVDRLEINGSGAIGHDDLRMVRRAVRFAFEAHAKSPDEHRFHPSDHLPFEIHLLRVASYLVRELQCADPELVAAAFTHDIFEWTPATEVDLLSGVGLPSVVELTKSLTESSAIKESADPNGSVEMLNLRLKSEHYTRLLAESTDIRSGLLKLVDSLVAYSAIDHVENCEPLRPYELDLFEGFMAEMETKIDAPLLFAELRVYLDAYRSEITKNANGQSKKIDLTGDSASKHSV